MNNVMYTIMYTLNKKGNNISAIPFVTSTIKSSDFLEDIKHILMPNLLFK